MTALALSDRDLSSAFESIRKFGAAIVPRIIAQGFLNVLRAEIEATGPFEAIEEPGPLVRQKFDRFAFLFEPKEMDWLTVLQRETEALLQRHTYLVPGLANWEAVDIVVQRYGPDDYLSAHRDLSRHPYLIASFTISGSCRFEILGDSREGPVVQCLHPEPGDLVLLRGPGFLGSGTDSRPYHRVSGSLTRGVPRIAVTFRDNTEPYTPIPHFSYRNYP